MFLLRENKKHSFSLSSSSLAVSSRQIKKKSNKRKSAQDRGKTEREKRKKKTARLLLLLHLSSTPSSVASRPRTVSCIALTSSSLRDRSIDRYAIR